MQRPDATPRELLSFHRGAAELYSKNAPLALLYGSRGGKIHAVYQLHSFQVRIELSEQCELISFGNLSQRELKESGDH
jgi:hypothetical protein